MKVDIHEQLEDGTRRRIATFFWRGGEIQCDNPVLWKHLMNSNGGVIIGSRGKRYYPRDGVDYLHNLKYQFAGPYLHAGPVEEEEADRQATPADSGPDVSTLSDRDVSSVTTIKTALPRSEPHGKRSGSGMPRKKGRRRDRVVFGELRRGVAPGGDNALSRDDLEAVCGGVYRGAVAFRGLSYGVARTEMNGLLETLVRLVGVDRAALARAFESREAYLELRYQPPSRQNYEKQWARAARFWQKFIDVLEAGDLEASLWPLYMTWEAMRCLPEHRVAWLSANDFEAFPGDFPAGTRAEEVLDAWERHGMPAFRKRGLSGEMLEATFARAGTRFEAAVAAFRDAAFSRAEAEVRTALSIDPGFVDARLVLGDILRRLDQPTASLVELQRTVELETLRSRAEKGRPVEPASMLRLARSRVCIGKTLLSEGRIRAAIHHLDRGAEWFERLARTETAGLDQEGVARTLLDERKAVHGLLERVYQDLGDVEHAEHHRKRQSAS